jgi:hypothetical protein
MTRRHGVPDEVLELILLEADEYQYGAAVATDNPKALRQRLYPLMKRLGVEFLLRIPAVEGELWLMKKTTSVA